MPNLATSEVSSWKNDLMTQVETIVTSISTCEGIADEAKNTVTSTDVALASQWGDLHQLLSTANQKLETTKTEYGASIDGYLKKIEENEAEAARKMVEQKDQFKEEANALNNLDI